MIEHAAVKHKRGACLCLGAWETERNETIKTHQVSEKALIKEKKEHFK